MTEILTRQYEPADWESVRRIHDAARPIELAGSCDPRAFLPLADDVKGLKEFHASEKWVAFCQTHVVGFVCTSGNDIGWLYVEPKEAGQGIGRTLVQYALAQITNPASVHVLEGNLRAKNLYLSEGFKIVDQFKSRNNGYPCTVLKMSRSGR